MATTSKFDELVSKFKNSDYASWYRYQEGCKAGLTPDQLQQLLFRERRHPYIFRSGSHIDPRDFFGGLIAATKETGIPEDYATFIANAVQEQFQSQSPRDRREIFTFGRVECEIPFDWHLRLVQKLLDQGLFVCDDGITSLEHPRLFGYNRNEDGTLKQQHTNNQ